jgi:hypothetical protein
VRPSGDGTQRERYANDSDAQTGHRCESWTSSQSRHTRAVLRCMTARSYGGSIEPSIDAQREYRLAGLPFEGEALRHDGRV